MLIIEATLVETMLVEAAIVAPLVTGALLIVVAVVEATGVVEDAEEADAVEDDAEAEAVEEDAEAGIEAEFDIIVDVIAFVVPVESLVMETEDVAMDMVDDSEVVDPMVDWLDTNEGSHTCHIKRTRKPV